MRLHPARHLILPKAWPRRVRSAVLHAVGLARVALIAARGQGITVSLSRVRIRRLHQEILLLKEEIRLKDARVGRIPAQRRPHYLPAERLAILELRAARGWSQVQTADRMLVTPATVASWMSRLDEQGPESLVQMRSPVNRFPDFVGYLVRRLKTLCPSMGKVRIAQVVARAGLHLSATTVAWLLETTNSPRPAAAAVETARHLHSDRPNHVWHIDLTTVPTAWGFWVPWLPWALPQQWPFCWWVNASSSASPTLPGASTYRSSSWTRPRSCRRTDESRCGATVKCASSASSNYGSVPFVLIFPTTFINDRDRSHPLVRAAG